MKVFAAVVVLGILAGIAAPSYATQISIDGTCTTIGASCSFQFAGDPTLNKNPTFLNWQDVDAGYFVTDPDGNTANTGLAFRWQPTGDFGQFNLASGADRVRIDFTSFDVATGMGMFEILLQENSTGRYVAFMNGGVPVIGSYSVTSVPLPAAAWLFFSALAGFGFMGRRRQAHASVSA